MLLTCSLPILATEGSRVLEKKVNETQVSKTVFSHLKSAYESSGPSGQSLSQFLDGMLVHRRVTPSIKFAGIHLYAWVKRGIVRVKCEDMIDHRSYTHCQLKQL